MTMYDQRQFEPSRVTSQSHICGCCAKLQAFLVAVWRNSGTNAMKTLHISTSVGVARFQPSTDVTTRHPIGHSSPSISLQLVSSCLAMILAKEGPMTEVTEKKQIWYLVVTFPLEMTRYWGFIPSIFRHKYHITLVRYFWSQAIWIEAQHVFLELEDTNSGHRTRFFGPGKLAWWRPKNFFVAISPGLIWGHEPSTGYGSKFSPEEGGTPLLGCAVEVTLMGITLYNHRNLNPHELGYDPYNYGLQISTYNWNFTSK